MTKNKNEDRLFNLLCGITKVIPEREYKFHPSRKWRFDFAFISLKIAIELEGAIWTGGRHVNPIGFTKDCEKYNQAAKLGWRVYRLVPSMINEECLIDLLFNVESMEDEKKHCKDE